MKKQQSSAWAAMQGLRACLGGALAREGCVGGLSDEGQNYQIVEQAHLAVAAQARGATGRGWEAAAWWWTVCGEDAGWRAAGGSNWARVAGVGYGEEKEGEDED